eukprot:6187971-Pleurochrysis_carterae.AAC.2
MVRSCGQRQAGVSAAERNEAKQGSKTAGAFASRPLSMRVRTDKAHGWKVRKALAGSGVFCGCSVSDSD